MAGVFICAVIIHFARTFFERNCPAPRSLSRTELALVRDFGGTLGRGGIPPHPHFRRVLAGGQNFFAASYFFKISTLSVPFKSRIAYRVIVAGTLRFLNFLTYSKTFFLSPRITSLRHQPTPFCTKSSLSKIKFSQSANASLVNFPLSPTLRTNATTLARRFHILFD